jgi:hypothetical protein
MQVIGWNFQAAWGKRRGAHLLRQGRRLGDSGVAADDDPEGNRENKKKNQQQDQPQGCRFAGSCVLGGRSWGL